MKTKFNGILTLLLALVVQISFAQDRTISGTVSDESGPLPGVNVLKKGTTSGVETDFDGKFSIQAKDGDILVFSFVGMKTIERTVGTSSTMTIAMASDNVLDEVVVTALGIKREKKSLGYAVQEVKGDDINKAKEQSFISSLSGRVAGLDVKKSNSIGGSVNVVLRGSSSLTGSNQALFVVDGIPISNNNFNTSTQTSGSGGYDFGNAASDINPEDIESISVLKGSTASALYGSQAANGVILITTKKGTKKKGLGITINNSTSISKIDKTTFPTYQNKYGAGYGPYYGSTGDFFDYDVNGDGTDDFLIPVGEDASFGGAFDPNTMVYQWDALYPSLDTYLQPSPWVAPKNGPSSIFQTGVTNVLNISLEGGNENGSFRFGYTNDDRSGILPNSKIKKDVVTLGGSSNLSDKLKISAKGTYSRISGKGRYGTGYDSGNVTQMLRQWWQTNVDLKDQKDAYFATRQNITWNPNSPTNTAPHYWDNPYWTLYENYETDLRNRFLGNANLVYDLTDWVSVTGRVGVDSYNDLVEERKNIGSIDQSYYIKRNRQYEQFNYDLLLNFNKQLSSDISFTGLLGASLQTKHYNSTNASTNGGLVVAGLYALSNSVSALSPPAETDWTQRKVGYYAQASFGFRDMLFLEGTFRRDVSSTLPAGNNAYNYPSGSASFLFSKVLNADWLNFGKVRASYAEVTNDAASYSVVNTANANDPFGSTPVYSVGDTSNNPDLAPETTKEFEVGLETKFFGNRLGFEASWYKKNTVDQILPVQVSPATGYNFKFVNAGEMENKGIELALNGTPVKTQDFEWNINVNWAKNENTVVSLFEDGENMLIYSAWSTAINARKGQPYGTITGTDYVYTNGQKTVGSDGKYLRTASTTEIIGNIQPDWIGGVYNGFKYKNFNFGFLIDVQQGGSVVNYDAAFGNATGLYAETAALNDLGNPIRNTVANGGGILLDGVKADGTPNDIRAEANTYETPFGYYGGSTDTGGYAPDAQFVYDASYVKLREVSLGYEFPKSLTDKLSINSLSMGISARNLWIIHKNLPYGDPEYSASSGNRRGIQNGTLPSTKDVSLNISVKF
ncbi:SusC/RagA family TonB-linked outer membrane protein [Tenacibaculum sp.]|uniref:SusC/RagA family TonB-linked outer membrane protein n=1 Tax=Tenacibaculum sp. TaxID=1906242 RepID=UPI003D126ACF